MDLGDLSTWSNLTMVDSRVVCAECRSMTHEAADCPQRKQRETNMANRVKHRQGKANKLAGEGLPTRLQPAVTPSSHQRAAYHAMDDIWMSTTGQMQLLASSLRPTTLSPANRIPTRVQGCGPGAPCSSNASSAVCSLRAELLNCRRL